ncbi:hypothetical protein RSJ17_02730 [Clostridium argentinense]|nr:hypothetical protein RSJ17_02730 [Clostridium argentinense]
MPHEIVLHIMQGNLLIIWFLKLKLWINLKLRMKDEEFIVKTPIAKPLEFFKANFIFNSSFLTINF